MAVRGWYSGSDSSVCSSGSGGSCSWSGSGCWSSGAPLRSVELTRRSHHQDHQESSTLGSSSRLGFSLRGGSEHGTGFFVTAVQPHSEAHRQGLMVGDQILRVNGYPVEGATHQELLHLIQRHNVLTLKVKAVGMIPVKENPEDELTWRVVEREVDTHNNNQHQPQQQRDVRILLKVPPKAKLGCGICKGPEWKPGMFVQFTKENSIARNAGLRPGDQILQCNNVVFTPDTPFNEAVSVLKWSGSLELLVRKGGGADLFPGESSGYNSSASSQAGDTTTLPHTGNEAGKTNGFANNENGRSTMNKNGQQTQAQTQTHHYTNGSTVIRVGGGPPSSHQKMQNTNTTKLAEICMLSQQLETKTTTVLVEVHHSEEDDISHSNSDSSTDRLTNSCSISSFTSSASSLNSAISQEIERRSKRASAGIPCDQQQQKDKMIGKSGLDKEKVEQHEQLMQEFKRAHRKMFSSSDTEKLIAHTQERQEEKQLAEQNKRPSVNTNTASSISHNNNTNSNIQNTNTTKRQFNPPPPPPLPSEESRGGCSASQTSTKSKKYPAPPPPPPSTSSTSTSSRTSSNQQPATKQGVDMESLESFKLTNPSVGQPKPPQTYFNDASPATNNQTQKGRGSKPVVRISEYCRSERRRSPARLDFLPTNNNNNNNHQDHQPTFQSELTHTLSRANLIAKNEPIVSSTTYCDLKCTTSSSTCKVELPGREEEASTDNTRRRRYSETPLQNNKQPFYLFNQQNTSTTSFIDNKNNRQGCSVTFNFNRKSVGPTPTNSSGGTSNNNGVLKKSPDNISRVQLAPTSN